MEKAVIVIQARYDSRRCPGKILREIGDGKSALEHLVERLLRTKYDIILATTDRKEDQVLCDEFTSIDNKRLTLYRGDYQDVLRRLYYAAETYEYIIRVTGDDIFVDTDILEKQAEWAINNKYDYVYSPSLIRGCDCDIMRVSSLWKLLDMYPNENKEHVEHFLKTDKFNVGKFDYPDIYDEKNSDIRLTIDTEDDYKLAKIVFENLYHPKYNFGAYDIVQFFRRNSHLKEINKLPSISVYTVFKDYNISWLRQAIESLNKQTFKDYEYILVDYGSNPIKLKELLKLTTELDVKIRLYESKNFIEAINKAIKHCRASYVLRLDADDVLEPNALERLYRSTYDEPSIVMPNYYLLHDLTSVVDAEERNVMSCALVDKKKYEYCQFLEEQAFRDGVTLIETLNKYGMRIKYLQETLFGYRVHENSLTNGKYEEKYIQAIDEQIKREIGIA